MFCFYRESSQSPQQSPNSPQPHSPQSPIYTTTNLLSRTRRYSTSCYSPLAANGNGQGQSLVVPSRVSQLRQEECADLTTNREVNHEREMLSAMQMSQSYEDLSLDAENWSFKSNDITTTAAAAASSSTTDNNIFNANTTSSSLAINPQQNSPIHGTSASPTKYIINI